MGATPATRAIRALREAGIAFTEHAYRYEAHGGTATAARELRVDERSVVKTLVLEDDERRPLLMLMHGNRDVSIKQLGRAIGAREVAPCAPEAAERHTGYLVGGISPFGTRKALPVYVERSILALERIYINGGRRGLLVALVPEDLMRALSATAVDAAQGERPR